MRVNCPLVLLVTLFSVCSLMAQNYNFGRVSKEELEEKFYPLDSTADAAFLYRHRETYVDYNQSEGFSLTTEVHERIKIYNKDGFRYATKGVHLYKNGSDNEKISGLKGYTYNLVDGKIEDSKLKNDGVFETELSRYWDQTKFTMPNIKEGSVIEYKYTITSPFLTHVEEFKFQYDIPIKKLEARFESPEYFNYKLNTKGFLMVTPKSESKNDKIIFNNKTRTQESGFGGRTKTTFSTSAVDFKKYRTSYDLEDIPALKDEPYVNNIDNYRSSVKYELSYTKFPNNAYKYYSTTWEDVVKTIYKNSDFGDELNKTGYYDDDIDALISSISDPIKRVSLIYDFVKSKVKWNGYYGKFTDDGVRKAYSDHTGNVAEINLMLTSMLRYAGLDANPVLVSTRTNGVPLFPTIDGYNYVISSVQLAEGIILLDATSEFATPNVLPLRTLNWEGRIIKKDGNSSLVSLYPNQSSETTTTMLINLQENGDIEGKYRCSKTNHDALLYRNNFNDSDENDFVEKLENNQGGLEISDFNVTNEDDLSKPVFESYGFLKESQADIIGDEIYFSPMFFLRTIENPFKLEKREFPVDFGYPSSSKFRITINLPVGYEVETAPDSKTIKLPDNLGLFSYGLVVSGSSIQLLIVSEMNNAIVSPLYYESLKEYFKQLIEKENEKIVLKKV